MAARSLFSTTIASMSHLTVIPPSIKEEAQRRADELFATLHILEIRDIANKTKAEAADKKEELKKLIGHRYHDIIDASDAIGDMRTAVSKLSKQLEEMGRLCRALDPSRRVNEIPGFPRPEDEMFDLYKHRLARQVDFLVRSPFEMELYLDQRDYVRAAQHYVVSGVVHKQLTSWSLPNAQQQQRLQEALKKSFAIVEQRWKVIQQFHERIGADCRACLTEHDETAIERDSFANALVALAILESRSPMQLFVEFIDRRKKAFSTVLNSIRERCAETGDLSKAALPDRLLAVREALVQFLSLVQSSLYQLGCIFIRDHIELLDISVVSTPTKSPSASSLTPVKTPSSPSLSPKVIRYEAQLISMRSQAISAISSMIQSTLNITGDNSHQQLQSLLPPFVNSTFLLSFDSVRNLATDWIKNLPKFLPPLEEILKIIASGSDLLQLRSAIVDKIVHAFNHLDMSRSNSTSSLTPSSSSNDLLSSSGGPVVPPAAASTSWRQIASVVFSEDIDLWSLLFHKSFNQRSLLFITESFSSAIKMEQRLDATLRELVNSLRKNDSKAEERNMAEYIWEEVSATNQSSSDHDRPLGFTRRTKALVAEFDEQLSRTLRDVMYIVDEQPKIGNQTFFAPSTMKADAREFRMHIQQACLDAVVSFCVQLRQRVETLRVSLNSSAAAPSQDSATNSSASKRAFAFLQVEQALAIARLARGLQLKSTALRDIILKLDPTDILLSKATSASSFATPTKIKAPSSAPGTPLMGAVSSTRLGSRMLLAQHSPRAAALFSKACRELDSVYIDGYLMWVENTSLYLEGVLSDKLNAHLAVAPSLIGNSSEISSVDQALLVTSRVRATWQELKVGSDAAEDYVPHQPSPFIVSFLFSVVQEIQRVGSHSVDRELVEALVAALSDRAVVVFDNFITAHKDAASTATIPKEVSLQFWFDVKFFLDILSCRTVSSALVRSRLATRKPGGSSIAPLSEESTTNEEDYDEVEEMLAWKKKVDGLVGRVKSLIDPIDLAFYTPHVTKHLRSCYQRMYILFGTLTQASALPGAVESTTTSTTAQQPAVLMNLVGSSTRFTLLPISNSAPVVPTAIGKTSNPNSPAEGGKPSTGSGKGKATESKDKGGIWDKFSSIRGSLFS